MSQQAQQDLEDDGSGFNPIEFAKKVFNSIRPFRSQLATQPELLIESPSQIGAGGELGENIINAFFRMLGLPAARSEEFLTREGNEALLSRLTTNERARKQAFSQDGTLNYFTTIGTAGQHDFIVHDIKSRNNKLSEVPTASDFNKMMSAPLPFEESLSMTGARRAGLFPLIVDAAVPIYPLHRRIAPLFYDGDYIVEGSQSRLSRPFIQHVLYIRSKPLSGNSTTKEEFIDRINELRPESLTDLTNLGPFSAIELIIQQRFLQSIRRLASDYIGVQQAAIRSRQKITFVPNPVENPEERSGQGTLSAEELAETKTVTPDIDRRIKDLKLALSKEEAIRFILPTEEVNRSDRKRRLSDQVTIRNFTDDALISDFTNLITYKEEDLRSQIGEVEQERRRALQEAEKIKRDLLYFTGEFTGLSIFDVIGVLYGLFTVEIKYLVGLLNKDAQDRLIKDPFFALGPNEQESSEAKGPVVLISEGSVPTVNESLTMLQSKVEEAFKLAQTFALEDDRRPVRRRGVTCR